MKSGKSNWCEKNISTFMGWKIKIQSSREKKHEPFLLLLIITSDKLKEYFDPSKINNNEYNIKLDEVKNLINDSRYFLIEDAGSDTLKKANTNVEIPDFSKENNFILKITGQGTPDIGKYPTKSWLRDNITSEICKIEKVLRLLDASIAKKFVPTL